MSDRRTEYSPSHNHCKRTIIPRPAPTLPKPHYPLLCTITLASLVKGRWIYGKAQALILVLSACNMPTVFMLQTFLPSRRRDCFTPIEPLYPHNLLKSTSTASPRTKLASPRKRGGGLTALQNRYSISSSFCNLPDCFQNCYTFCRQDGGD